VEGPQRRPLTFVMKTCLQLLATAAVCSAATFDPLAHVNLFIGTVNGGNTFPGEQGPF
jgi:hypothetical protein